MRPAETGSEIRVAVVEEHEILCRGLVASLAEDRNFEVTMAEPDGHASEDIDIAIVSSSAAHRDQFPCPIVVCVDHPEGPRSVAAGNEVAGVLHSQSLTVAQLHATVHAAAAGLRVNAYLENGSGEVLEPRALRLLGLIADGYTTREIADQMSYSERTIKKLITEVQYRMKARSRAQIVAQAIRRGLI